MGGLRRSLGQLVLCLIAAVQAPSLAARSLPDPLATVAACTGRLSAVMEFQWLIQDPGSDATKVRRDEMADLMAAATPPGGESRAMALRIEAKVAATRLLHRARFGPDGPGAEWARRRVARLLTDCAALMVS